MNHAIHTVVLVEESTVEHLYPLTIMHASWQLRLGALTTWERTRSLFPEARLLVRGRELQTDAFHARNATEHGEVEKENTLILSASLILDRQSCAELVATLERLSAGWTAIALIKRDNYPVAAFVPHTALSDNTADNETVTRLFSSLYDAAPQDNVNAPMVHFLWDTLTLTPAFIERDAALLPHLRELEELPAGVVRLGSYPVLVGSDVEIDPFVFLDTRKGPIILDDGVTVMSQATIIGPNYIGRKSVVKIGAKIYQDCSFGPVCKIGGEIENTILLGYSNKQHDGFVGHSVIGEWVNLGADTNTSDLKNNYSNVRVTTVHGVSLDTKRLFLGLLCGDHTRTSINTMFNTGTTVGICANIFSAGFPEKFVRSFSWGGGASSPLYDIDKAIATAKTVMKRRNKILTKAEEVIFWREYDTQRG